MKRITALVLALLMICSFAGCRKGPTLDPNDIGSGSYYGSEWEYEYVEVSGEENPTGNSNTNGNKDNNKNNNNKNNNNKNNNTSSDKKGTTTIDRQDDLDLGVKVPKGKYDFGGKELVISVWTDSTPKLGKSKAEDARYYAMQYTMRKYNIGSIKYKVMASGSVAYNTAFVKYAASGDFWGDIMNTHSDYVKGYIQKGLIQNIKPAAATLNNNYFRTDVCSVGSGAYGFSTKGKVNYREHFLVYNTDLIKKNNLEDPKALYKKQQWTWDKYQEYVRTITDSNKDIYGMAIPNFHSLFNDPAHSSDYIDSKGKYVCGWLDPKKNQMMDKLYNWIIEMYNENTVFGDFIIGQEALDSSRDAFRNGKIGFIFADNNNVCKNFKNEGLKNYSIVAAPTADGKHKYYNNTAHYAFWSLPVTKSRYPAEQVLAVANDLFCTTDPTHGKAYYEQSDNEKIEELYSNYYVSKEDAKYYLDLGKVTTTHYGWGIFVNESFQVAREMLQPVLQGKATWQKVKAQYAPQRQADIDSSLNSGLYK